MLNRCQTLFLSLFFPLLLASFFLASVVSCVWIGGGWCGWGDYSSDQYCRAVGSSVNKMASVDGPSFPPSVELSPFSFSLQDWVAHFSQIFNRFSLSLKRDLKPRQSCNSLSTFDVWIRVRRDNSTVSSEHVYIWWNGVGSLLTQSQGKEARESHIVSYSPQAKSTSSYIMYAMLYLTKDSPCIRIHISTIDSTHESRASHYVFLPPTLYDPSYHTLRTFQSPPLSRSSPFCLFHADRGTMTVYLLQIACQPVRACWFFNASLIMHAYIW